MTQLTTQLNEFEKETRLNTRTMPHRSHYKFLMLEGRVFPATKAQAKYFISNCSLDVLNGPDVIFIEQFLNKHGYTGLYVYTKSKSFARLVNQDDLNDALKKEHKLKKEHNL